MIEHLEGVLAHKAPALVHLQVGPIRFEISVPLSTAQKLPEETARIGLWIHLQWKEDGPVLFGFATRDEREIFRLLLLVQGIGPRIALSVLAHHSPAELVRQIRQRSVEGLTRIPGIGPKTAGRILVELGPRVDRLAIGLEEESSIAHPGEDDAVQALTALGYPPRESRKAVERILQESPSLPLDECLRRALRRLAGAQG